MILRANKTFRDERGMALLLTLLVTVVLTGVVIEFNYDANVNVDIAENYMNKMKAGYLAKSGVRFANLYLSTDLESLLDESMSDIESLLSGKPIALGSGFVTIHLDGEEGKINVNKLLVSEKAQTRFFNLLTNLDADEQVYYNVIDWLDKDDDTSGYGGAESGYYATLAEPYPCRNGLLESVRELRLVKGIDDELFSELEKNCTIYSTGLININEASKEVLLSLSEDLSEYDVEKIIEDRQENEYENINELSYLGDLFEQIKGDITVDNKNYKITSVGVVDGISYKIVNHVEKVQAATRLQYSREE